MSAAAGQISDNVGPDGLLPEHFGRDIGGATVVVDVEGAGRGRKVGRAGVSGGVDDATRV